MKTQKQTLRTEFQTKRPTNIREASEAITAQVLASPFYRNAASVFVYVSTPDEPDTAEIIKAALADGKRVYVPKCGKAPHMDAVRVTAGTAFVPGRHGIPEPADAAEIADPAVPELILIPCVAAAENGVRLGHGGGYYDAFLSRAAGKKICLCFAACLVPALPEEDHDVRMDAVITE